MTVRVNSCTRSRSSSNSSSVGGVKPAGCLVETLRAKTGENAGLGTRRSERVVVRRREGRRTEAIAMDNRCWQGVWKREFLDQVDYLRRVEQPRGEGGSPRRGDRPIYIPTRMITCSANPRPSINIHIALWIGLSNIQILLSSMNTQLFHSISFTIISTASHAEAVMATRG